MLAARNRLRARRDIARVAKRGRFGISDEVTAKANQNHLGFSRAVVVVSKKASKKAVVRNRIRRRVAAALAESWATVAPGYDIVITIRADISEMAAPEMARHLSESLRRSCGQKPN